jgi:hypothetical protein
MAFRLTFWAPMAAAGLFLLWWVLFSRTESWRRPVGTRTVQYRIVEEK